MLTIVLGLAAACLYSLYNLFSQRLLRSMSWMTITVAMFVTGLVLLGVPALLIDGLPFADDQLGDLGLAALGGLLYTLATGSFLLALRVGKLSVVVVLACLDGAFAAAISIAMGEKLSAMAAAGLVLAAGGGLLAAVERTAQRGGWGRWRAPVALRRRRRPRPVVRRGDGRRVHRLRADRRLLALHHGDGRLHGRPRRHRCRRQWPAARCCRRATAPPASSGSASSTCWRSSPEAPPSPWGPSRSPSVLQAQTATVSTLLGLALAARAAGLVAIGRGGR